jgi:hypothetical protein
MSFGSYRPEATIRDSQKRHLLLSREPNGGFRVRIVQSGQCVGPTFSLQPIEAVTPQCGGQLVIRSLA